VATAESLPVSTRSSPPFRVLLLGGTGEASEIAARLAERTDIVTLSSLAGRVSQPRMPQGIVRVGGFGGVTGLIAYLAEEQINAVIDATHPFAAKISRNAEAACTHLQLPLIAFARPPWVPQQGDHWHDMPDIESAAAFVESRKGRVFLAIGRQELAAFSECHDAWFLIRAIDPPQEPLPPRAKIILERGPFDLPREMQLLHDHAIDYVVSKNSGGAATYSKIAAARAAGIPLVMIHRPLKHNIPTLAHIEDVLSALNRLIS
jgi:precorrin-6A/cobalt-precorrin-6A reductase